MWTVPMGCMVSRLGTTGQAVGIRAPQGSVLHFTPPPSLVVLYDCSVGHGDCSRCQTAMPQYDCVWCEGERPRCVAREACNEAETVATQCPAPLIHSVCWDDGTCLPFLTAVLRGGMSVPWMHRTQNRRLGLLQTTEVDRSLSWNRWSH